jgi:hypothetical protein
MKKFVLSIIVIASMCSVKAQNDSKIRFNIGAELAFATGNLSNAYSINIGGTAQLGYVIDDKTQVTLNSGITEFIGKKIPNTSVRNQNNPVIPILGGVKYYFADNFFGSAQVGVSLFTGKVGAQKFTYAPGLGFKINEKVEALLKYTGYSNFGSSFGVRVAYNL